MVCQSIYLIRDVPLPGCIGKTALNCGPQSETTQNAAKTSRLRFMMGFIMVYHLIHPYVECIYIYIYLYIYMYLYCTHTHIYIYIAHDLPPYVKPLDHMRPDADPEPLVRGLLLMESVASAPNFPIRRAMFFTAQSRVDSRRCSLFDTHI